VQKRFPILKLTFENENMHKVRCKIQNRALALNNYCNLVDISIQLAYYWVNIVLNYLYHAKPAQNLFSVILCINLNKVVSIHRQKEALLVFYDVHLFAV
jgi:hypothetical protein